MRYRTFILLLTFFKSQNSDNSSTDLIRTVLTKVPGFGSEEKVQEAENIKSRAYNFNPDDYASEEVQKQFMDILIWRDDLYRDIAEKIEMIPGLEDLLEELTNALNTCIFPFFLDDLLKLILIRCLLGTGPMAFSMLYSPFMHTFINLIFSQSCNKPLEFLAKEVRPSSILMINMRFSTILMHLIPRIVCFQRFSFPLSF